MGDEIFDQDDWTSDPVMRFKAEAISNDQLRRSRELLDQEQDIPKGVEAAVFTIAQGEPPPLRIVAEGDSWFDYALGTDIIDCLMRNHPCIIDNFASAGDTLENMIYGTRVRRGFRPATPTIHRVLRRLNRVQPKIFLFSGGGNDIVGDSFGSYINHKLSGLPTMRQRFMDHMVHVVFRQYLENLIEKVRHEAPNTHIVFHGYGYAVPSGDGAGLFGIDFKGPWLLPALAQKRVSDVAEQRQIINTLIDLYNDLLEDFSRRHDYVHYVNLRPLITDDDWADELHLNNQAHSRVANAIYKVMQAIP